MEIARPISPTPLPYKRSSLISDPRQRSPPSAASTAWSPARSAPSTTATSATARSASRACCSRSAPQGATPRDIRARLGLDSGYLARLLRALQRDGLVTEEPNPADRRTKRLTLTAAGRAEMAELDRISDELAAATLAPLDEDQRARLLRAQAEVRRLLAISMVSIAPEDPASADARWCLSHYFAELAERFEESFDPARTLPTGAGGPVPARPLRRPARRLRRAQGARRGHRRAPAHVGRPTAPRPRHRRPPARRARAPRRRARARRGAPVHEPLAGRGEGALPRPRLPRDRPLQRRPIRRPLVREAAVGLRAPSAPDGTAHAPRRHRAVDPHHPAPPSSHTRSSAKRMPNVCTERQRGISSATPAGSERRPISPIRRRGPRATMTSMPRSEAARAGFRPTRAYTRSACRSPIASNPTSPPP